MSNSSIWPLGKTLSCATTPGRSGSNVNERVLCIPQSYSIMGASPSHCLVSYPGHSSRSLPLCGDAIGVFCGPSRLGHWKKENSEFKLVKFRLKIDLVSHMLLVRRGFVDTYTFCDSLCFEPSCYSVLSVERRIRSPKKWGCPGYVTRLHLMVRLEFWRSGECGVLFHCHYSHVHFDSRW